MGVTGEHAGTDHVGDILVIEPDPEDAGRVHSGFDRNDLLLTVTADAQSALELLAAGSAEECDDALPSLVVLDLELDPIDGLTVLDAIKSSPQLSTLPVVVFVDSERTGDVDLTRELGANCHLPRPEDPEAYVDQVETIARFWFDWAEFPRSN
jgi:CheY-like chemotaxis protein